MDYLSHDLSAGGCYDAPYTLSERSGTAGGPDRWRVINIAAGGRHNLILALPDNGDLTLQHDAAMRRATTTQWPSSRVSTLCPAACLRSCAQKVLGSTAANQLHVLRHSWDATIMVSHTLI